MNQGCVDASWNRGSDSNDRWLGSDWSRLRCCRSGHWQRLRGDDCRLAGDDAEGIGLSTKKGRQLARHVLRDGFAFRVQVSRRFVRVKKERSIGSLWGGGDLTT